MKLTHIIPLGVLDFEPISRLTIPLVAEVEALQFKSDGTLISPWPRPAGSAPASRMLVAGRHMTAGAVYAITIIYPAHVVDEEPVEERSLTTFINLDSVRTPEYEFSTQTEAEGGTVEAAGQFTAQPYPLLKLAGQIEMRNASSRLAGAFYRGRTEFDGSFDLPVVADTGRIVDGTCKGRGFKARLQIDLKNVEGGREFEISLRLTGRRLMRPLVFITSPFVRYVFKKIVDEELRHEDPANWQALLRLDLKDLDRATRTTLDARNFMNRCVQDEAFLEANLLPRTLRYLENQSAESHRADLETLLDQATDIDGPH